MNTQIKKAQELREAAFAEQSAERKLAKAKRWARIVGADVTYALECLEDYSKYELALEAADEPELEPEPITQADVNPAMLAQGEPTAENGSADAGEDLARAIQNLIARPAGLTAEQVQEIAQKAAEGVKVDEATIRRIVDEYAVKRIEFVNTAGEIKTITGQHREFECLLKIASTRTNVWLVGPAGSGKTTAAARVAEALDLPFYEIGAVTSAHQLFGYMDGNGVYHRTAFREAFEFGGVFLLDEVDGSIPNEIIAANGAIAASHGQEIAFPDGMVAKHEDCVIIAGANTYGQGRDRQYVGRYQADAAFLDRFAILDWDYDEVLEASFTDNKDWVNYVQKVRHAVQSLEIRHVVSPRATINGAKFLAAGIALDKVKDLTVFKGMPKNDRQRVEGAI